MELRKVLESALKLLEEGKEGTLAILIEKKGSGPREPGAIMLIRKDGTIEGTIGGGTLEKSIIEEALKVINEGSPKRVKYDLREGGSELDLYCGGAIEVFIMPLEAQKKLYIFGGGHIARALIPMAKEAGFRVILFDDRNEVAKKFTDVDIKIGNYTELSENLRDDPEGYVLICTESHTRDLEVLKGILKKDFRYVGMLGSKHKFETLKKKLPEELREKMNRVKTPVGLDIGAKTPFEIAVSIVAELIKERRK